MPRLAQPTPADAGVGLRHTHPDEPVLGLKLLLRVLVVVDQAETLAGTTTKLGLHAENDDPLLLGLVQGGELVAELIPGQVGSGRVEDSEDKLLSVEQSVRDELGGSDGNGAGGVLRGFCQSSILRLGSMARSTSVPPLRRPRAMLHRRIDRVLPPLPYFVHHADQNFPSCLSQSTQRSQSQPSVLSFHVGAG